MFSGIVETIGLVHLLEDLRGCLKVVIAPLSPFHDIKVGDSIAVNGTCLTVTQFTPETFTVDIVPETRRLTNLNDIATGKIVNLERSLKVGDRIGGHYVQGHIDDTGTIIGMEKDGQLVKIQIPARLEKYIVPKGYVAIDGMSITVINASDHWFSITIIPHTKDMTVANQYRIGTKVNLEVDILSKYIEKIVGVKQSCSHT
jgi:riboflavin synthase